MVKSPCINVCRLDVDMVCVGCFRSIDEIDGWEDMSDIEKIEVAKKARDRKMNQRGEDYYGSPLG